MRPKAVIFDLFHTLTAWESEWSKLPWTSDVLGIDRAVWDRALTAESRWRLAGEERDPFVIVSRLARAIDPRIRDETLHRAIEVRISRFREALLKIPVANINALTLLRLSGFRLGLISNADVMEVAAWKDSPLAGLFDVEVFSCEVGCVKPEPEIFAKCLGALGVRGGECMFVGDGGSNELAGARSAGMTTVLVSGVIEELWPARIPERLAHADHHLKFAWEVVELLGLAAGGDAAGPRRQSSQKQ
jgi:putative hydrolase of the HAD superfamily